jgi:predicted naringenin-chalcone synthase
LSPLAHSAEQLVVQTLFADGFIAYGVGDEASWDRRSPALELLSQDEQLVPDSTDAMSWTCSDWGMQMGLLLFRPGYWWPADEQLSRSVVVVRG